MAKPVIKTNAGNVKQLEGFDPALFRLRVGDWRLIYRRRDDDAIDGHIDFQQILTTQILL